MSLPSDSLEIDCQTVRRRLSTDGDSLTLLDCREQDEYDLVHLSEARLLPMSQLMARVGELEDFRDKEIVVLCHHGSRSRDVAQWLIAQGFSKVKSMAGGIDQWAVEIDSTLARY